ncbi:MAG: metabolite traffic protein EboE [Nitrospirota bacterium]|nr:metabolite traffic protein EboE [Nitrospirota bacterium]
MPSMKILFDSPLRGSIVGPSLIHPSSNTMMLALPGHPHLTYCTNIHPGESWAEVRANIERYVLQVKSHIAPDRLFGIGLRLSHQAAVALSKPDILKAFVQFLDTHGLYVFTINGFPYGPFHGQAVKEQVYLPDWLDERRLGYTDELAQLLAKLLPSDRKVPNLEGSISTVPGAFQARIAGDEEEASIAARLLRHLAVLHGIRDRTGRVISLALEPEPCCMLETVGDTIRFFQRHLFSKQAQSRFSALTGLTQAGSEEFLQRHLGVCLDACHMAVEFEDPVTAIRSFQAAGIRISKIQLSAGLNVVFGRDSEERLALLERFNDGVYLHQVVERNRKTLIRYRDLPEAVKAASGDMRSVEWRIHCHVPLCREHLGPFMSTQAFVRTLMAMLCEEPVSPHLEIETYTWSVLPQEYRDEDIVTSVVREMRWILDQCGCPSNE